MEVPAKVSGKGQITIPKPVREALGLTGGEEIVFRIEEGRAILARTSGLLGAPRDGPGEPRPASPRAVPWDAARRSATHRHTAKSAMVVRDTDGSALTIELVEKSGQPTRR